MNLQIVDREGKMSGFSPNMNMPSLIDFEKQRNNLSP